MRWGELADEELGLLGAPPIPPAATAFVVILTRRRGGAVPGAPEIELPVSSKWSRGALRFTYTQGLKIGLHLGL